VVDRLTKWAIFIPATINWDAPKLFDAFMDRVVAQHGFPRSIVSDRGSKFTSKFWKYLTSRLGIDLLLSTSYHPQTDGQTERTNQAIELYLRLYSTYRQDDWVSLLPRASMVYNNSSVHSSTKSTPFFANFGYHPRWIEEMQDSSHPEVPSASSIVTDLSAIHAECVDHINQANERFSSSFNASHTPAPEFVEGDLVRLSLKNVKTKRRSKKMDWKFAGPIKVLKKIGTHSYRLELPPSAEIHDVFHVDLLEPFITPSFPGQQSTPPQPLVIDNELRYVVKDIVDVRRFGQGKKLQYKVLWEGYEGTMEEATWEPVEHLEGSQDTIDEYHEAHPESLDILNILKRK